MQIVSSAYREQMKAGVRNPSFVELRYSVLNADAQKTAVLNDNGGTAFSTLNIVDGELEDEKNSYLSFEPGRWPLDKKLIILPDDDEYYDTGFVSEEISDADGVFAVPPELSVSFAEPQGFYGLTLVFDTSTGEYPAEIEINGVLFYPQSAEMLIPDNFVPTQTLTIRWINSGTPYRRARLTDIIFGQIVSFSTDQLIKTNYSSSVDFLSTELPKKKLSFTIDNSGEKYNPLNPQGVTQFVEDRQPVMLRYGFQLDSGEIEWLPWESFMLQGTPTAKNLEATFTAVDSISALTGVFYKGLYRPEGISLYDLATEVLTDAEVEDYELDERLKEIYTKGALPAAPHNECLQIIANAGQCILYTDRNGNIRLQSAVDPVFSMSDNGHTDFSDAAWAFNDASVPEQKYLDFLPGSWRVGQENLWVMPEDGNYVKVGFVSDRLSGEDGTVLPDAACYTIEYSFPAAFYPLPITFDAVGGEYATAYRVVFWLNGTEIHTVSVENNDSVEVFLDEYLPKTDKVEIYIDKWNTPYRRPIIGSIGNGRINNFTLALGDVYQQPTVQKQAPCKSVTVNYYSYTAGNSQELYKETVGVAETETTLKINHDAAVNITAAFTGGTILSEEHYTYQSVITLSGEGELVLTGNELVATTTSLVRAVNTKGEDKPALENPLITDMQNASETLEWVADYFNKRNILSVQYRGNPELDVYDAIYMESRFSPAFPVRLMELSLDYNGALNGKAKAVMI